MVIRRVAVALSIEVEYNAFGKERRWMGTGGNKWTYYLSLCWLQC